MGSFGIFWSVGLALGPANRYRSLACSMAPRRPPGSWAVFSQVWAWAKRHRPGRDQTCSPRRPVRVSGGLSYVAFEVPDGGEGFVDYFAMLLTGLRFFQGEDAELAGESMAMGIEAATALAFWSLGARGMVGARSVVDLLAGHSVFLLQTKMARCWQRAIRKAFRLT
jgi:hypothetical protein